MTNDWVYGLVAEFATDAELVRAAEKAYERGYRKMDGYTPFPIEGLAEALGKKNRLPLLVLLGGILGGTSGYFMEWFANASTHSKLKAKYLPDWLGARSLEQRQPPSSSLLLRGTLVSPRIAMRGLALPLSVAAPPPH